jgi:hypothetical protein
MNAPLDIRPKTLGLFEKRIEGDDGLLELARLRFQQAGMGAEMHAAFPEELERVLKFRPSPDAPVVVHLARNIKLSEDQGRSRILEFAARFAGRLHGLVIHDQAEMASPPDNVLRAARKLASRLDKIRRAPILFIEYAVGLEPSAFARFAGKVRELGRLGACIDVGHVGVWQARHLYRQLRPGEDIIALKGQPARQAEALTDVEKAVASALPVVLDLIGTIGSLGKPVHFHLHDAHPLSTLSPFGVSDHLSFLAEIPVGFQHHGRWSLPPMYGPAGLMRIATKAREAIGYERTSFTLEIHPVEGRQPLGDAASLFTHWRDKTNAEHMNHWLGVLQQNHSLLLQGLHAADGDSNERLE